MDFSAIATELALPAYAGMTINQKNDALNALSIDIKVDIRINDLEGYLLLQQLLPELEDFGATTSSDPTVLAAIKAAKALTGLVSSNRLTIVQTSDPDQYTVFAGFVGALQTAGQLTQAQHDAVLAMADGQTSRAIQIVGRATSIADLQTAGVA